MSIPVAAYRVLMLVWALWLAFSVLKWVRWAWACYSAGSYWKTTPALFKKRKVSAEPVAEADAQTPDSSARTNVLPGEAP